MTWSDKFSVGVQSIDDQHAGLVETLNELHDGMMKGHANAVTGKLLHTLVDYTREHFAAEEMLMASTKYPQLPRHCEKHRELTRQVEEFVGRYERGEIRINLQLLNFLSDWLSTHILKEDHAYGPWLNDHGIR